MPYGKKGEDFMAIQPILPIQSLQGASKIGQSTPAQPDSSVPFQSLFEEALSNVKESSAASEQEVYNMVTGQSDNLHDIMIRSTQATLSVELFVQLRNKALDAYNEVMRMGV